MEPKGTRKNEARQGWITFARALIFTERLWPALLPALGVLALFLAVSLFGLWQAMPFFLHWGVLALTAGLTVFLLVRELKDIDWPSYEEGLRRLEADGHVPHGALQALEDRPFGGEEVNPLWKAHQRRMHHLAEKAVTGRPRATADARDPYFLRYAVLLLLVFALFLSWGRTGERMWQAFNPQWGSSDPVLADIWIDPPAYTGKAPVILASGTSLPQADEALTIVPAGSVLTVRLSGDRAARVSRLFLTTGSGRAAVPLTQEGGAAVATLPLSENSVAFVKTRGTRQSWQIAVQQDDPPTVRFREAPSGTEEQALRLPVGISDDYGITEAVLRMRLSREQDLGRDASPLSETALARVEDIPLSGISGIEGARTVEVDLTDHPFAGLNVSGRIIVRDGAGQEDETLSETFTLPAREFYNPLARAVIHERRTLAASPESWPRTGEVLAALTTGPELFYNKPTDYLLMRAAYWNVREGAGDNTQETIDDFWPLALQLEDQSLELARRALEEARRALLEALERNAPPEEINRLIENLRMAMNNYIDALARSGEAMAEENSGNQQMEARDLQDMLDQIGQLAESGANNAARQMLSELEQMLQNLQFSQSGGGGSSGSGQGGQGQPGNGSGNGGEGASGTAGRAGSMIGAQRQLADETFDARRRQQGLSDDGGTPRSASDLAAEQEALAGQLQALVDELSAGEQTEAIAQALRDYETALEEMEFARAALNTGQLGTANEFQEQALEALRQGADSLAEQLLADQNDGDGGGGEAQPGGEAASDGQAARYDPLGRPYGAPASGLSDTEIPDLSDPARARELILELRRRLADPNRTREETEYLERLLERF